MTETHTHILEDGTVITHTHHEETHSHDQAMSHNHEAEHDHPHAHDHDHSQEHGHPHTHDHDHSQEHDHPHVHGHGHHGHTHTNTKAVLNRLARAIGHLESIKRMVEDGRDCSEVLIQLSAVKSAINNTGKIILQDHIEHCIVEAVAEGDLEALKELNEAIDRFMK